MDNCLDGGAGCMVDSDQSGCRLCTIEKPGPPTWFPPCPRCVCSAFGVTDQGTMRTALAEGEAGEAVARRGGTDGSTGGNTKREPKKKTRRYPPVAAPTPEPEPTVYPPVAAPTPEPEPTVCTPVAAPTPSATPAATATPTPAVFPGRRAYAHGDARGDGYAHACGVPPVAAPTPTATATSASTATRT